MKNTLSILALAATAAATGFRDANPFSCPGNTDNKCTETQHTGFDFSDLGFGSFSSYNNFNWKGWTCGSDSSKRFAPRTNGKKISASCGSKKEESPSFGCGANIDKFSLGAITIKPEFTCDLEFHYDMPDGSTCKHRSRCDKSGTTVKNSQCGGAKNVTIVYPPQSDKPKPTCSVDVHTISFECSSTTKPTKTATTKTRGSTTSTSVVTTTSETKGIETTSSTSAVETGSTTTTTAETTTSPPVTENTSATSVATTTTTSPRFGNFTTSTTSVERSSTSETKGIETTSEVIKETTSTFVTSFQSTSTVFTTVVSTITSCAETVTNCPGKGGVATTIVTIALSTTICPVTETRTTVISKTKATEVATETTATSVAETTSQAEETTSNTEAVGTTAATGTTETALVTTTTSSVTVVETLPCPNVVPQCLNTFLFSLTCSDNSDSSCYCPDEIFVKNVFDCIYAHGESAEIVSEAVIFFQGICAPYAPSNPAIVTGATVTSFVTVSATATTSLAPVYTTVTVEATTIVPCTDSAGSTITGSSSTIVVSTQMTVPNVGFTTGVSSVGLVPITTTAAAAVTGGSGGSGATATGTTLITAPPQGTGSIRPTQSGSFVTVSSGGRVSAGFGFALAVMAVVAAL